jgi:hypothetical protein
MAQSWGNGNAHKYAGISFINKPFSAEALLSKISKINVK